MSVFYPPHFRHLESKSGLHGDELPRSTGSIAVRPRHEVVRTPAGETSWRVKVAGHSTGPQNFSIWRGSV